MAKVIQSEQIDAVLRKLASARNVNSKVEILKDNDSAILRKVMTYAYSPYIKFGITINSGAAYDLLSVSHVTGGLDIDDADIWALLDEFKSSTESPANKHTKLKSLCSRLNSQTALLVVGILQKSVVKGISESTINKAWPDTIPVFSLQLANKYTDRKIKSLPQYVEIKYDGVRAAGVIHPSGEVACLTRTGRAIPAASYFYDELRRIGKAYDELVNQPAGLPNEGCVTDGELCGDTFNDAVSIFRSETPATEGAYHVFDILPMQAITDKSYVAPAFEERRKTLELVMNHASYKSGGAAPLSKVLRSISYLANSKEEIWQMYTAARSKGLEGVIVKDPKGGWERKRSNNWLKIKAEDSGDFRVIGAFEGEGEMEGTLGGLIVEGDMGKRVESRVGSGFTDADRDTIWMMFLRDLERHEAGITDPNEFELIGCIAEVQFQEVTPDGSLRHPVFKRLRKDKEEVNF